MNLKIDSLALTIEKWRRIKDGERVGNNVWGFCALCDVYEYCDSCPIGIKTGLQCCRHTPYEVWHKHRRIEHHSFLAGWCDECEKIANDEYDFLVKLYKELHEA